MFVCACLCVCAVPCRVISEPSSMPVGVWARSISASEIEVNWQTVSFHAERVLGYEVCVCVCVCVCVSVLSGPL